MLISGDCLSNQTVWCLSRISFVRAESHEAFEPTAGVAACAFIAKRSDHLLSVVLSSVASWIRSNSKSCITSNTRTPTSVGFGASHGAVRNVVEASESPCSHRMFIVLLLNS